MPDGELRRPPQLWEQRLSRLTSVLSVGLSSSGATSIVEPTPAPGAGGGTEPAPVLPSPGEFIAPSTPTLIGSVQGINVVWDGLNSSGDLWPSDTSYIEVHMSTSGPTFTPSSATLKGRLARPGGLSIVGLARGTTYYFRLRGADPAGNVTDPSTAASGQPGQINAPDIAANAITANSIVAGTITGWQINASYLSGGTVSGGYITGGTVSGALVTGGTIQSTSGNNRVAMDSGDRLRFYYGGTVQGSIYGSSGSMSISALNEINLSGDLNIDSDVYIAPGQLFLGDSYGGTIRPDTEYADLILMAGTAAGDTGYLTSRNVYDWTSGSSANVVVGALGKILRSTSRAAEKYRIVPLVHELADVPADKISTPEADGAVDMWDVLDLAPSQFARHEDSQRVVDPETGEEVTPAPEVTYLGFIAEDVAAKFPVAAEWDEAGDPSSYDLRAIVSALLGVVAEQQTQITALTARIEALEA